uniref:Multidrug resistance protein, MATE family n=1 Tax=Candidatus Kentrum sp. FM TaxID=2126340 RepID=A0A450VXC0_9GAMM|nr:MAG: multidrug resistance protein, MATE family [Candidatus Kentron sp. FM]VFJ58369.1 MAG: multidrug resistance protein, MATE family [Candidatus Kentron sp. FM]VFK09420.1 MAG: multidrug resistance protein, MATE family [Candidatus Kentron sp. FM]
MSKSRVLATSKVHATIKASLLLGLGYLGEVVISVTDKIMLGHLGPSELGAVGLALSVYEIILLLGIGLLFPVIVLVSQARGAARSWTAPRIIRQGLWVVGFLAVPGGAVLWHLEEILLLAGQDPRLAQMAGHYMDYYLWTLFPALGTFMFICAFAGMDRGEIIVFLVWSEAGLNIVLDYLLIFGKWGFPAMGMAGAGLASIIVYGFGHMAFFTLLAFHRSFRSVAVFRRVWRPRWEILREFLRLGWPKSLENLMEIGVFSLAALLAGRLGVEAIASHTIAYEVYLVITITLSIAVANTVASHEGFAKERRDASELWGIFHGGLVTIFLFMLPLIVVLKLFSPWVVMLFVGTGPEAQILIPFASPLLVLIAFFALVDGVRIVATHASNGLSDVKMPALIMGLSSWGVGVPCGLILAITMDLGVLGFWLGLTMGMIAASALTLMRFRWVVRYVCSAAGEDTHG